jgi:hypothetical protein
MWGSNKDAPMTMQYAKDGFAFLSVSTPSVFEEYEIPVNGKLRGRDLRNYERLQDLAEIHRTSINSSSYRTG